MSRKTKYPSRAAAAEALERAARREIKHYFTDWTEYDKPDLLNPEKTPDGSELYFLTRESGSYLLNPGERAEIAEAILSYYIEQSAPEIRKLRRITIQADAVTVETVNPAQTYRKFQALAAAAKAARLAEDPDSYFFKLA